VNKKAFRYRPAAGFTLLEVLVALTVLAVGAALTISVVSSSLGNIRKVQLRTRAIHHAETVMELTLLDESVKGPTTLNGDFEDGTRWAVAVSDYEMPEIVPQEALQRTQFPLKMLSYRVEVYLPGSGNPDFRLETLKLVSIQNLPAQVQP